MVDALLERAKVIRLTTIGRKSGRPHSVEVWFVYDVQQKSIYILAHQGTSQKGTDWYRNVRANPKVIVAVRGQSLRARFVPVAESEAQALEARVRSLFAEKYGRATISYWYGGGPRLPVSLMVESAN